MMSSMILWRVMLGSIVSQNQIQEVEDTVVEDSPLYEGTASWYDYTLNINWEIREWSKSHDTCALRIYDRYKTYKVCTEDKCITCYHNDYGPARQDRVIDLSSHAFKQLAPLKLGLVHVKVFILD